MKVRECDAEEQGKSLLLRHIYSESNRKVGFLWREGAAPSLGGRDNLGAAECRDRD